MQNILYIMECIPTLALAEAQLLAGASLALSGLCTTDTLTSYSDHDLHAFLEARWAQGLRAGTR